MYAPARTLLFLAPAALIGVAAAAACSSGTAPLPEDHTPASYTLLVNDNEVTETLTLAQGETVHIRLMFRNAASKDLDDVESEHFAGLTFHPSSLATVRRTADHHYQFDVTGANPGTGTVTVSFGHDELADDTSFPAAAVVVSATHGL